MNKPPTDWTPEEIRRAAASVHELGFMVAEEMLCHFAAMMEAEARGERCVLPLASDYIWTRFGKSGWVAGFIDDLPDCKGNTEREAIAALAEKLNGWARK